MATNRKGAEEFIIKFMTDLDPSFRNRDIWKDIFKKMSDKDFGEYMSKIRAGERTLVLFAPLYKSAALTTENGLAVAEKYGIPMFESIVHTGHPSIPDHVNPIKSLLIDLNDRRQSQDWIKKVSVPADNKTVDQLTYQPTGASKGSKLSAPEIRILNAMKLPYTIEEMSRYRGGDKGGFRAMNAMADQVGSISLAKIAPYTTGVESTKSLKNYFFARLIAYKD